MAVDNDAVEIFDVTIRDGSYVIDFQFRREDVSLLYGAIDRLGFRYIEVGHGFGLNASSVKGAAAASDDEYLEAAAAECSRSRFGAFFIPGIGEREHLRRARERFGMHFVRVGNEPEKSDAMLPYVEYARGLGYEVMANFMKTYAIGPAEAGRKAAKLAAAGAQVVYVVDSAGGMFPDEVADYVRAVREHCPAQVGFHGHNNLELASANALAAMRAGATLLDCSIGGLGRSAGNTRTELLIPVLKALGVPMPYDYQGVLRVWQEIIRPLMARRPVTPQEVVGGYARIHSGLMGPFLEAARRHGVGVEALLCAYGDALHGGDASPSVDKLAAGLAGKPEGGRLVAVPAARCSLLEIQSPLCDRSSIRNTFRSVEEVLRAVNILSHKAALPVVALVSVEGTAEDDAEVMAEYLYHDEHFIVLRAAFPSVPGFLRALDKYRGWFDVLVFEGASEPTRQELRRLEPSWRRSEEVLWADLRAARYQYLCSALHHLAGERGARRVLLVGGAEGLLGDFLAARLEGLDVWRTAADDDSLHQVAIRPLERAAARPAGRPRPFEVAVILATLSRAEMEAVLSRLEPTGVIVDCLGQTARHAGLMQGRPQEVLPLSLRDCISGELLTLLRARLGRPVALRFPNLAVAAAGVGAKSA